MSLPSLKNYIQQIEKLVLDETIQHEEELINVSEGQLNELAPLAIPAAMATGRALAPYAARGVQALRGVTQRPGSRTIDMGKAVEVPKTALPAPQTMTAGTPPIRPPAPGGIGKQAAAATGVAATAGTLGTMALQKNPPVQTSQPLPPGVTPSTAGSGRSSGPGGNVVTPKPQTFSKGVTDIANLNKIADPNFIRVGQTLNLPGQDTPYTVKAGDTLSGIAARQRAQSAQTPPSTNATDANDYGGSIEEQGSDSMNSIQNKKLKESKKKLSESTIDEILKNYPHEHKACQEGWGMHESLYQALCDHYWNEGKIPREKMYGNHQELRDFVEECYLQDTQQLTENPLLGMAVRGLAIGAGSELAHHMLDDDVDRVEKIGEAEMQAELDSNIQEMEIDMNENKAKTIRTGSLAEQIAKIRAKMDALNEQQGVAEDQVKEAQTYGPNNPYQVKPGEDFDKVFEPGRRSGVHYYLNTGMVTDPFYFKFNNKLYSVSNKGDGLPREVGTNDRDLGQDVSMPSLIDYPGTDDPNLKLAKDYAKLMGYNPEDMDEIQPLLTVMNSNPAFLRQVRDRVKNQDTSKKSFGNQGVAEGVYRHKGTYGTSYDPNAPGQTEPAVKRGRGRPSTKEVSGGPEFSPAAKSFFGIPNKPFKAKNLPGTGQSFSPMDAAEKALKSYFKLIKKGQRHEDALQSAAEKFNISQERLSTFINAEKDVQMENWDQQLQSLLKEGMTVTTSTGNEGASDSVSVSATDADAQTLMKLLQNSGLLHGKSTAMSAQANDNMGIGAVTVAPVSADEVMGTLEPQSDDQGEEAMGFLKRMLGARQGTETDAESDSDYATEKGAESDDETCETCGHADCECDHDEEKVKETTTPPTTQKVTGNVTPAKGPGETAPGIGKQPPNPTGKNPTPQHVDEPVSKVKEALKGGQEKLDVAPPHGKLTAADFKALRKKTNEEDMEEGNRFTYHLAAARKAGATEADLDGDGDMEKVREEALDQPATMEEKRCDECGGVMEADHQCESSHDKLDEWANSPAGKNEDEQFLADISYMTKSISGGLNNIKQDQTTLPSTRVNTATDQSIAEMLRKLQNIN